MPFINSKVTVSLTKEKKDSLKAKLGEIITLIPGKSEEYLMIGFQDEYSLYFKGKELSYGAFVEIKLFGKADKKNLEKVTEAICKLYAEELNIPGDCIYVTYQEVEHWGFNGLNYLQVI